MSIYRMRTEFGKHFKWILGGIAVIFIIGAVWQFGAAPPSGERGEGSGGIYAEVNGLPVTDTEYMAVWTPIKDNLRGYGLQSTLEVANKRGEVLLQLIESRLVLSGAKKLGVDISQDAVDKRFEELVTEYLRQNRRKVIEKMTPEQERTSPWDDRDYADALASINTSVEEVAENARRLAIPRAQLEVEVAQDGIARALKRKLGPITDKDITDSYGVYKVRQILIATGKLPQEQALNKANKILKEARGGKDFAQLARSSSDGPLKDQGGAAEHSFERFAQAIDGVAQQIVFQKLYSQGGRPTPKVFQRELDAVRSDPVAIVQVMGKMGGATNYVMEAGALLDAAQKLKPGQISDLVTTPSGYYILKLESIANKPPAKMDKKAKAERRRQIEAVGMVAMWIGIDQQTRSRAVIKVRDPEMAGYWHQYLAQQRMMAGDEAGRKKELSLAARQFKLAYAEKRNNAEAAAKYVQILEMQGKTKEAAETLYGMLQGSGVPVQGAAMRIWLADMFIRLGGEKNKERAIDQLEQASESAPADRPVHDQLVSRFEQLGRSDLVAREKEWIADYERKVKEREERDKAKAKPAGKPAPR